MSGSFSAGVGRWLGAAEVYDERGRFAGGGHDSRVVTRDVGAGTVEVDVSFVGPFRMAGTYVIADHGDHRRYQGPVNLGYAEVFGDGLISADNYWPDTGFNQRFFLMVVPGADGTEGGMQLSLALLSRGAQGTYVVVGEYHRQPEGDGGGGLPAFVAGSSYDLGDDPTAGRGVRLLERPGRWSGELAVLDEDLSPTGTTEWRESVRPGDDSLHLALSGTAFAADASMSFTTTGWQHFTGSGPVVGSASVWGSRALSGDLLYIDEGLRLWRREVACHDGTRKGVVHHWYRGDRRIGVTHGVLDFEPA